MEPIIYPQSFTEGTQTILRGNDSYFVCNSTTSVVAVLTWRRINPQLLSSENITYVRRDSHSFPSKLDLGSLSEICQSYSNGLPSLIAISLEERVFASPNLKGALVLVQSVALVFCHTEESLSGFYECYSPDSESSGLVLNVKVYSPTSDPTLIIVIVGVVIMIFVITFTVFLGIKACLKYHSIKYGPQLMWPEEPNSPLVLRDVVNPSYRPRSLTTEVEEDQYEFPRERLQLGPILGTCNLYLFSRTFNVVRIRTSSTIPVSLIVPLVIRLCGCSEYSQTSQ